MSILRTAALTVASGLVLLLTLSPLPASAHDEMIEATPSQGSALGPDDPPFAAFRFSGEIFPEAAFISVVDPSGADVSVGDPTVAGDTVSREFAADAPGTYTASYRVTSSDGHPIEGSVNFTYNGPAAGEPSPDTAEDQGTDVTPADPENESDRDYTTVVIIVVATAVLVVGTAVAISMLRRRRR
ncbi:copper resistance CopC family protein [Aeromicrobium sp. Sec7.5]|uniref:copper resistance CopC family protein n=1 Tax=Aeromicrobium sp. Sec7.5 TaxID=3121276 RepID=UPI002FE4D2B0